MKTKLYLLLAGIIFIANISFGKNLSSLNLSVFDGRGFYVELDNSRFDAYDSDFFIGNLEGGRHFLKVYSDEYGNSKPLFSGHINIPAGYAVYAVINDYYDFEIYRKQIYRNQTGSRNEDCTCNCEACKYCRIREKHGENNYGYRAMDDKVFAELISSLNGEYFDETKTDIMLAVLEKAYVTSAQVKDMLKTLSFESSRLTVAKSAYKRTVDKENYFRVFTEFSFSSSVKELKDYIRDNEGKLY